MMGELSVEKGIVLRGSVRIVCAQQQCMTALATQARSMGGDPK